MNRGSILVLDDERRQQEILSLVLREEGYEVVATGSPAEALRMAESGDFDLILTDLRMPSMDGIEFLRSVRQTRPDQVVVVITAHGSVPTAVEAMKQGAFHYLTKPLDRETLLLISRRAVDQARLISENALLRSQLDQRYAVTNIVGQHGAMNDVFRLIQKVAPTNTTVIIYGESGVGKELVARAIHLGSPRSRLPMQAVNCAAIPENLLESELFGYERGAFTGAYARRKGLFEIASGSTLFLDEIGDLGLALQGKILRVLQEKEFQRLGGNDTVKVDVRVISATRRDLSRMMAEGEFREDLYYRLNTFPIMIPPLRERATDIPLLVDHFLKKFSLDVPTKRISAQAMDRLLTYSWPGNVRQLESAVERAMILAEGEVIEEKDLPPEILCPLTGDNPYAGVDVPNEGLDLEELEKHLLRRAMEKSGGVVAKAARLLHLSYRTLQYRLEKYQMTRK